MRIYYVGESRSRTLHVATALGVDGEHRNSLVERIMDWRWVLEESFNVPTGRALRGPDLLSPTGRPLPRGRRNPLPTLEEGLEILMEGLRVLEHSLHNRGGISVINVCRRNSPFRRNRAQRPRRRPGAAPGTGQRLPGGGRPLRPYHRGRGTDRRSALARLPVDLPAACRCARDGDSIGGLARDTAVYAPPHRVAGDDELLQLVGLVSYSLLQQEEPTHMAEALNFHLAFGILNRVLDRRACPQDPQGVDRL